ncbi:hypothetical protein RIVM261_049560 [Rivularia sp. IAM M-261]|nr:hypothetical protein RIVM261_049560 [Rivularia sp. IAM M-261]
MNNPNSKDHTMKWMGIAMVACCAIPIIVSLSIGGGFGFLLSRSNQEPSSDRLSASTNQKAPQPQSQSQPTVTKVSLEPAVNWQTNNHVHGLAVNRDNPKVIYIATHNGLLQRSEIGDWYWMGKERADYMGFTADPTNSNRFYASGHPPTGGNLGFIKSENQGQDWQQISMPGVDFHALAISPSNPQVFYGFPVSGTQAPLHISKDGGKTWNQLGSQGLGGTPFELAVDPRNPDHVFATTRAGMYESSNGGNDWTLIPNTQEAPIVSLALLKDGDTTVMYGYRFLKSAPGIYRSNDGGKTWNKLWTETSGVIVKLASSANSPQVLYAVNDKNAVFQSLDRGQNWRKIS